MDLEKQAHLTSHKLDFHAAIMQEAYNEVLDRPEGNPSQHYFRGSVKEAAAEANSVYRDALQIMELQNIFDLGHVEELPEEEVRLAKEKYFSGLDHEHTDSTGDAMDSHTERIFEARKADVVGNDTGFHHLRSSVSQYEELIRKMTEAEPETDETEIIQSSENTVDIDKIDHILGREI